MLPNFQARLAQEIIRAINTDKRFASLSGLTEHIDFLEEHEHGSGKVFGANCRAWVGGNNSCRFEFALVLIDRFNIILINYIQHLGSLIGSLKSTVVEISREKYTGQVPDWTTSNAVTTA